MSTTRVNRHIDAPPSAVYRALLDPDAVQRWMVPDGMTSEVHEFDACDGGRFRISLTYEEPTDTGKTTEQTDSFHGRFVRLVSDAEVVQAVEFETDDSTLQGVMTVTYTLTPSGGGTDLVGLHEDVPPSVDPEQNEIGWTMSLGKLAAIAEAG